MVYRMMLIMAVTIGLGLFGCYAKAAERFTLDKELIGTWCALKQDKEKIWHYRREVNPPKNKAPCRGDDWMEIKKDGYEGGEFSCRIVNVKDRSVQKYDPIKKDELSGREGPMYWINHRCSGEGYSWKELTILWHLGDRLLVVTEKEGK